VSDGHFRVTTRKQGPGGGERVLDVGLVMMATGRKPRTEGLGLEVWGGWGLGGGPLAVVEACARPQAAAAQLAVALSSPSLPVRCTPTHTCPRPNPSPPHPHSPPCPQALGVELDKAGAVKVDDHSRTNVPSVWAIGDITNRINLTVGGGQGGGAAVGGTAQWGVDKASSGGLDGRGVLCSPCAQSPSSSPDARLRPTRPPACPPPHFPSRSPSPSWRAWRSPRRCLAGSPPR
jgi:hypothetical protein